MNLSKLGLLTLLLGGLSQGCAFAEVKVKLDIGIFGLDLTFRHTRIDYSLPDGPSISANSFGIFCGLQLGLIQTENVSARYSSSN